MLALQSNEYGGCAVSAFLLWQDLMQPQSLIGTLAYCVCLCCCFFNWIFMLVALLCRLSRSCNPSLLTETTPWQLWRSCTAQLSWCRVTWQMHKKLQKGKTLQIPGVIFRYTFIASPGTYCLCIVARDRQRQRSKHHRKLQQNLFIMWTVSSRTRVKLLIQHLAIHPGRSCRKIMHRQLHTKQPEKHSAV